MTRVVVTGDDSGGVSEIVRDEQLQPRAGGTLFDVWAYDNGPVRLPSGVGDGKLAGAHFPAAGGLRVYASKRLPGQGNVEQRNGAQPPPDLDEAMKRGSLGPERSAGFHVSDTVDVAVIIAGEMGLELEDGSMTMLRQGDIVIQNGTNHAWHPSETEGCEIAWVLVGAVRDPA
jgi:hypothetical protein